MNFPYDKQYKLKMTFRASKTIKVEADLVIEPKDVYNGHMSETSWSRLSDYDRSEAILDRAWDEVTQLITIEPSE